MAAWPSRNERKLPSKPKMGTRGPKTIPTAPRLGETAYGDLAETPSGRGARTRQAVSLQANIATILLTINGYSGDTQQPPGATTRKEHH